MNDKTDIVTGDSYERLAFERVMSNRKERMYARKVDYLIDMNETNGIFSGHYEIQTILFLVTIIFVTMLTICHFGKNFQRMSIAVIFSTFIWICIQTWNCINS